MRIEPEEVPERLKPDRTPHPEFSPPELPDRSRRQNAPAGKEKQ